MLKGNKHVHDTACISKYRDQISKQMSHHWMSRRIFFQFNMKKESLRSEHWIYINTFVVVGKKIFNGAQKGMQNKKKVYLLAVYAQTHKRSEQQELISWKIHSINAEIKKTFSLYEIQWGGKKLNSNLFEQQFNKRIENLHFTAHKECNEMVIEEEKMLLNFDTLWRFLNRFPSNTAGRV